MAVGTNGCRQMDDCCRSLVKSHANLRRSMQRPKRNPPTADDLSGLHEQPGYRHSTADSPSHCRTLAERDQGQWHCLEPPKRAFRSVGDWPMHCYFH